MMKYMMKFWIVTSFSIFCISGMNTEGIYRIPGNKLQVELLQSKLQEGM